MENRNQVKVPITGDIVLTLIFTSLKRAIREFTSKALLHCGESNGGEWTKGTHRFLH